MKGQWRKLSKNFMRKVHRFYPHSELECVRFAENMKRCGDNAYTMGTHIVFPVKLNFSCKEDVRYMLHELAHVEQYNSLGFYDFLIEYVLQTAFCIAKHRKLSVHDEIPFEIEAEQVADSAAKEVFKREKRRRGR